MKRWIDLTAMPDSERYAEGVAYSVLDLFAAAGKDETGEVNEENVKKRKISFNEFVAMIEWVKDQTLKNGKKNDKKPDGNSHPE